MLSRVSDHGFPLDMVNTTRFKHFLDWLLPSALTKRIRFRKCNSRFNHTNYGLASAERCLFYSFVGWSGGFNGVKCSGFNGGRHLWHSDPLKGNSGH